MTPDITLDEIDPLSDIFPSASSEFAALRAIRSTSGERRSSIKHIVRDRVLSTSVSFGVFTDADTSGEIEAQHQMDEVMSMLHGPEMESDELLAGPIELELVEEEGPAQARLTKAEKRGSGLVMSEQLDDLEKRKCASHFI